MNQGRVWCVVHPTVGLPLLLGSVALTSLIVHACVMTQTTWMSAYWSGSWRNRVAVVPKVAEATAPGAPAFAVTVTPVPGASGKSETAFVVSVTANPGAKPVEAIATAPGPLALAAPATE